MSHDKVVQERRVLLPYLVLLIDNTFLGCLVETCTNREAVGGVVTCSIPENIHLPDSCVVPVVVDIACV